MIARSPIAFALAAGWLLAASASAEPDGPAAHPGEGGAAAPLEPDACLAYLDHHGVAYARTSRPGIAIGIELRGPLGGVSYSGHDRSKPPILDCSLAVSLLEAAPYFASAGIDHVLFSSTYSRRNVRGTNRPSRHSYGLAIDVHSFAGPDLGTLVVRDDFEQGLGDTVDCIGQPLTQGGALLKILDCQLVRSGLFRTVLTPDYDDAHYNHYHLEARPWPERLELRGSEPTIH
jgi:hypothetical protein